MPKYLVIVSAKRSITTEIVVDAPDDEQAEKQALDLVHRDQKWSLSWDVVDDEKPEDPQVDDIVEIEENDFPLTEG